MTKSKPTENQPNPALVAKATVSAQRQVYAQKLLFHEHELERQRQRLKDSEQTVEQLRGALQAIDSILAMPDFALPIPLPNLPEEKPAQPETD